MICLDKLKLLLKPTQYIEINPFERLSSLGIEAFKQATNATVLNLSGKIVSSSNSCGGITPNNYKNVLQKLEQEGILIKEQDFLSNVKVLAVDVTKDIIVQDEPKFYISALREALCPYTRKIQILIYEKDLGAKESLLIKPITKTSRSSLCIYSKYSELIAHRHKEPAYFEQFSPQFLETCKNLLRFELRLTSFRALREAFHIERKGTIFVKDLLFSECNVIYEYMNNLTGGLI